MIAIIITFLIGVVICVLGFINMSGNISSLHEYHRSRVSEENVKPFGRLVGIGTVIVGASVILYSLFLILFELLSIDLFAIVGAVLMLVGVAVGIVISFYAMKKYNGGIF